MIVNSFLAFLSHPMTHSLFWSFQYLPSPHKIMMSPGLRNLVPLREYPLEWRQAYCGLENIETSGTTNTYRALSLMRIYPEEYTPIVIDMFLNIQQSNSDMLYHFYALITHYDYFFEKLDENHSLWFSAVIYGLQRDAKYYQHCEEWTVTERGLSNFYLILTLISRGDTHPYLQRWTKNVQGILPQRWYASHPLWKREYPHTDDVSTIWMWLLSDAHDSEECPIII